MTNHIKMEFDAKIENVSISRVVAASFIAKLNPTLDEVEDVKVAVSEAVTNAVVHGYDGKEGCIFLEIFTYDNTLMISVRDTGCGIENIERAREPLFTTKPAQERSGLGFTVMESFMDSLHIESKVGRGTTVTMTKRIGSHLDDR
ncbi:MAG: anti-sigma F factor [Clostridia bacterium]